MKSYEKCVKLITYGPCAALIGSLLIGSPQGFAQNAESSPNKPLRLTVAPKTSSRISMKTLPKALCLLHPEGDSAPSNPFKLFSDDEGMIRFNVNPSEESDQVAAYAVDCTADGQSSTFELQLRANAIPTSDMPAPVAEIHKPKASDVIRPALTKAEALQLSDEEVIKREYPVRPNRQQKPDAFSAWLQIVTKPARRVNSRQVADAGVRASTWEADTNWSGFALYNAPNPIPVGTYDLVEGEWYVPTVSTSYYEDNTTTSSFFWVGLDGNNAICPEFCPPGPLGNYQQSDLWQAGTLQSVTNYHYGPWGIFSNTFSTYGAWSEFVPTQSAQVMPDFNVSPGDLIYSEVYVGDVAGGSPSLPGLIGTALIEDLTQHEYGFVFYCLGQTVNGNCTNMDQIPVYGYQAEWIMERPYDNETNVYSDLADFGEAWMYYPYALQTNGEWASYNGANSQDIWMYNYNTGDLLAVPYVWNDTTIEYVWYNFH